MRVSRAFRLTLWPMTSVRRNPTAMLYRCPWVSESLSVVRAAHTTSGGSESGESTNENRFGLQLRSAIL